MQGIYKHYIIDMSCNNNFVQVPTVQGDGNNVRGFEVELIANNVQYIVDPSIVNVCIAGTKPDTKLILNTCQVTTEGYILVDITQQMAAVAGRGDYSIMLMDKNTNSQLKSFPFYILTTPSAYSASDIISSNEFGTLVEKINEVKKLEHQVNDLENTLQTNEAGRISAENQRVINENIRQSNEETRIDNENTRKDAEAIRVDAENARNAAESQRNTNETIRINAENIRITNENERITNENIRQSNEETRIDNENDRQYAETIRINEESIRDAAEKDRINEESIRQINETIRQQQEAQRQIDTSEAIINANNATDNANTQANYAKVQGDYAETKADLADEAAANATNVKDLLLQMLDNGDFKGEKGDKGDKGDPGKDGVITTIDINQLAFQVIDDDLILTYEEGNTDAHNFSIDSNGCLVYNVIA